MSATERRVFHFDMEVKRRGNATHLPPLIDLLAVWKERSDDGDAFQDRSNGDLVFSIDKVAIEDDDLACLLLSVTDKNSPDSVYGDLKTGVATVNPKTDTQGGMHSAHLVISTEPYKSDTYFCVIEYAPKLNQSNIEMLLNRILHDEYDDKKDRFTSPDPSGRKDKAGIVRRQPFLPRVELKGYLSDELLTALEEGAVKDITLTSTSEQAEFGDSPYLVEKEQHLVIEARESLPRKGRFADIYSAVTKRAADYNKARIRFVDSSGRQQNIDFNVEDGSVFDARSIKSEFIKKIWPPLADASPEIVEHLASPMKQIVRKHQQARS